MVSSAYYVGFIYIYIYIIMKVMLLLSESGLQPITRR